MGFKLKDVAHCLPPDVLASLRKPRKAKRHAVAAPRISGLPRAGHLWTLDVPGWRPPLLNELMGRSPGVIAGIKKRAVKRIGLEAMVQGVPAAAGKRRVTFTLYGKWSKPPDADAVLKVGLDMLVTAGLLVDDGGEWCEWERPRTERGPVRTVITLEET